MRQLDRAARRGVSSDVTPAVKAGTLVLRGGAVGDFVVTLPLLNALRCAFPNEALDLVAHPAIASIASAVGLADAVHSIESASLSPFFSRNAPLPVDWSERFRAAARVISFLHDPDGVLVENVRRAGANSWVAGPPRPIDGGGLAARQLAQPIERALGLSPGDPASFRLKLDCTAHEEAELSLVQAPWIALHPGSGSPRKNWPVARWIEVAQGLVEQRPNLRFVIIGGEADRAALQSIGGALAPGRIRIMEGAPLPQVAAWIAACEMFLGHDTGISHLAAATGIPCVLLFGPSDASVWLPPQPRVRKLQPATGVIGDISVERVLTAIAAAASGSGDSRGGA